MIQVSQIKFCCQVMQSTGVTVVCFKTSCVMFSHARYVISFKKICFYARKYCYASGLDYVKSDSIPVQNFKSVSETYQCVVSDWYTELYYYILTLINFESIIRNICLTTCCLESQMIEITQHHGQGSSIQFSGILFV